MENLDLQTRSPIIESRTSELESTPPTAPEAGMTADLLNAAACPHCGRRSIAARPITPFGLLVSLARLVIATGSAVSLIAIFVSLFRWGTYRFVAAELAPLFAIFVVSIGVLLLYEIRDLLRRSDPLLQTGTERNKRASSVSTVGPLIPVWQTIGAFGWLVWFPFQSQSDRHLIEHLTSDERQELLHRLATLMVCVTSTTIAPVMIAFAFLSPLAVCIAATAVASNLFVFDWFKSRHKRWLRSTTFARQHPSATPSAGSTELEGFDCHGRDR